MLDNSRDRRHEEHALVIGMRNDERDGPAGGIRQQRRPAAAYPCSEQRNEERHAGQDTALCPHDAAA